MQEDHSQGVQCDCLVSDLLRLHLFVCQETQHAPRSRFVPARGHDDRFPRSNCLPCIFLDDYRCRHLLQSPGPQAQDVNQEVAAMLRGNAWHASPRPRSLSINHKCNHSRPDGQVEERASDYVS